MRYKGIIDNHIVPKIGSIRLAVDNEVARLRASGQVVSTDDIDRITKEKAAASVYNVDVSTAQLTAESINLDSVASGPLSEVYAQIDGFGVPSDQEDQLARKILAISERNGISIQQASGQVILPLMAAKYDSTEQWEKDIIDTMIRDDGQEPTGPIRLQYYIEWEQSNRQEGRELRGQVRSIRKGIREQLNSYLSITAEDFGK